MNKIIYVPLENLEQRYTKMMNEEVSKHVDMVLYPDMPEQTVIKNGQFLDITGTCIFKAMQLKMIAELFDTEQVKDGDVFLIADIFFPGIEMIRYMAELLKIKVYIYGFNYAGRADKTDFVQGLGNWADHSERGYHELCDGIFVGSEIHRTNILNKFGYYIHTKTYNTGYVWSVDFVNNVLNSEPSTLKEDYIIWPHRICDEKGIHNLLEFAKSTDKQILITSSGKEECSIELPKNVRFEGGLTKKQYYERLASAKYYLSTAYQETFGYTLQEAMVYGCEILVPDRACYPEMVPAKNLYKNVSEIDSKFNEGGLIVDEKEYLLKYNNNINKIMEIIYENSGCRKSD